MNIVCKMTFLIALLFVINNLATMEDEKNSYTIQLWFQGESSAETL